MERGPLALFGAIIAVGLGPALWIGVQIGPTSPSNPVRPPAVVGEQGAEKAGQLLGGSGAGEESSGDPAPRGNVLPLTTSPKVKTSPSPVPEPSESTTSPQPDPTRTTTDPTDPATPADPGTTAPPESTTLPDPDPTDVTTPPVDDESGDPTDDPSDNDWSDDDPSPSDATTGDLISSHAG